MPNSEAEGSLAPSPPKRSRFCVFHLEKRLPRTISGRGLHTLTDAGRVGHRRPRSIWRVNARKVWSVTIRLDIGGEGRYEDAWNLNPSAVRTVAPHRGELIPQRISGRVEAIPLPDDSVEQVIMERTPIRKASLYEIARIVDRHGTIVLRHAMPPNFDPHLLARAILPGHVMQRRIRIGRQDLQETCFQLGEESSRTADWIPTTTLRGRT